MMRLTIFSLLLKATAALTESFSFSTASALLTSFSKTVGYFAMCLITVGFMFFIVCMLTFFRPVLEAWAQDGGVAAFILSGLVLVNFVPELIINVVFSPASQRIIDSVSKKM